MVTVDDRCVLQDDGCCRCFWITVDHAGRAPRRNMAIPDVPSPRTMAVGARAISRGCFMPRASDSILIGHAGSFPPSGFRQICWEGRRPRRSRRLKQAAAVAVAKKCYSHHLFPPAFPSLFWDRLSDEKAPAGRHCRPARAAAQAYLLTDRPRSTIDCWTALFTPRVLAGRFERARGIFECGGFVIRLLVLIVVLPKKGVASVAAHGCGQVDLRGGPSDPGEVEGVACVSLASVGVLV